MIRFTSLFITFLTINISAQLSDRNYSSYADYSNSLFTVDSSFSKEKLISKFFLANSGVKIINISYSGSRSGLGFFSNSCEYLGYSKGLILSTGNVTDAMGPNTRADCSSWKHNFGNPKLDSISGNKTYDAVELIIDFAVNSDSVSFEYIFASEEYPEFVDMGVNDVFAFWIEDLQTGSIKNIATLPNDSGPVSVNNINQYRNSKYFINNDLYIRRKNCLPFALQFDGLTTILKAKSYIKAYHPYRLRFAIADAGDGYFDSAVLIRMSSFRSSGKKDKNMLQQTIVNSKLFATNKDKNQIAFSTQVHFANNSNIVPTQSYTALDSIVELLNTFFDINIEIHGHCDNTGTDELNQKLSEQRAASIKLYLVSKGISPKRLVTFGHGSSTPIKSNDNEPDRSLNRRVEFVVY